MDLSFRECWVRFAHVVASVRGSYVTGRHRGFLAWVYQICSSTPHLKDILAVSSLEQLHVEGWSVVVNNVVRLSQFMFDSSPASCSVACSLCLSPHCLVEWLRLLLFLRATRTALVQLNNRTLTRKEQFLNPQVPGHWDPWLQSPSGFLLMTQSTPGTDAELKTSRGNNLGPRETPGGDVSPAGPDTCAHLSLIPPPPTSVCL